LLIYASDPWLTLWMVPIAFALITSPAQSVLTSSTTLGLLSKARGFFLTEDDTAQAMELAELHQSRQPLPSSTAVKTDTAWEPAVDGSVPR
jgi:membrane glycosyltransferase